MTITAYRFNNAQSEINNDLFSIMTRYQESKYQRPIPAQQQKIWHELFPIISQQKLILDSGCGTGVSTSHLADRYPQHLIIGIDKSCYRLGKHMIYKQHRCHENIASKDNIVFCQAELTDIWRLMATAKLNIEKHFILYPNPWPKPQQVKKRFYAHPVFPTMLTLSPQLVCRSNWDLYLKEMQWLLQACFNINSQITQVDDQSACTRFESKYLHSGVNCYELTTSVIP